jgi:hypothetical protein
MEHTETETKYTEEHVRKRLLDLAWLGTPEEQAAEVECILAQDGWKYLSARVEQVRGQSWDDEQAQQAEGHALSDLYECHAGPHLETCPASRRSGTHV